MESRKTLVNEVMAPVLVWRGQDRLLTLRFSTKRAMLMRQVRFEAQRCQLMTIFLR